MLCNWRWRIGCLVAEATVGAGAGVDAQRNRMGSFSKKTDKELLDLRNKIFKDVGIPALLQNNFEPDPYTTSWHGEYDKSIKGYIYQFSRLSNNKYLERIEAFMLSGERWIQIFLNIFELQPEIKNLSHLKGREGLKFGIPANAANKMRLRSDDYKGPPLFYMLFRPEHKLGKFNSPKGYERETNKLRALIRSDMENIDSFVKRWHELHQPNVTDWEGNIIGKEAK